ncbi:MAG: hypothetical protein IJ827_06325, partial [Lachnospiraceae bacterium]|nr:hypothetical protein [Lachnospiraceae bacterium]
MSERPGSLPGLSHDRLLSEVTDAVNFDKVYHIDVCYYSGIRGGNEGDEKLENLADRFVYRYMCMPECRRKD